MVITFEGGGVRTQSDKYHFFFEPFPKRFLKTLKSLSLQENDEELQKYEALAQENREKYQNEKKNAEDVEVELLSLQRKVNF